MAKEYKFMFDRRFDEPEEDDFAPETSDPAPAVSPSAVPSETAEGSDVPAPVPSISEILDSLNGQVLTLDIETAAEELLKEARNGTDSETENDPETAQETQQESEPPPVVAGFTEEEMETARSVAFEEGRQKGIEEGRDAAWKEAMESDEKHQTDVLERISVLLKDLEPYCKKSAQTAFDTATELAFAVCKKAFPALGKSCGVNEVREMLEKNFQFLTEEAKIIIRLNPADAEPIKKHIAQLVVKTAYAGKITVLRDESIASGDCSIEWKNGGMERNTQDVLNQTEELLRLYRNIPSDSMNEGEKNG